MSKHVAYWTGLLDKDLVRLIGATRRQAQRMIAWEALITTRPMAAFGRGE